MNNVIEKAKKDLFFDLTDDELNDVKKVLTNFEKDFSKIQKFDLTKYNFLNDDLVDVNGLLREDEIIECNLNQKELFQNAIDFKDSYVVLKNEK